jgi:hypothetical protein
MVLSKWHRSLPDMHHIRITKVELEGKSTDSETAPSALARTERETSYHEPPAQGRRAYETHHAERDMFIRIPRIQKGSLSAAAYLLESLSRNRVATGLAQRLVHI